MPLVPHLILSSANSINRKLRTMKTIVLSLFIFATLLFFSSAAPLDKPIDAFTNMLGLPKPEGKPLSRKAKPPNKLPGPKLFPEIKGFEFISQIPASVIPKINALKQDGNRREKHLSKMYFAPLQEPKRAPISFQEDASKDVEATHLLTENQNHITLRKLK